MNQEVTQLGHNNGVKIEMLDFYVTDYNDLSRAYRAIKAGRFGHRPIHEYVLVGVVNGVHGSVSFIADEQALLRLRDSHFAMQHLQFVDNYPLTPL